MIPGDECLIEIFNAAVESSKLAFSEHGATNSTFLFLIDSQGDTTSEYPLKGVSDPANMLKAMFDLGAKKVDILKPPITIATLVFLSTSSGPENLIVSMATLNGKRFLASIPTNRKGDKFSFGEVSIVEPQAGEIPLLTAFWGGYATQGLASMAERN